MLNISLLENFIKHTLLESKGIEKEEEIISDFLKSSMYDKIKKIIESSQIKISESKNDEEIITSVEQISKIHKSLAAHLGDVKPSVELNEKIEALRELNRLKSNESFHQREVDINKFIRRAGIALETAPFLFVLVYLFNTNNDILANWFQNIDITMPTSLVMFLAMFLFGRLLRSGRESEIRINQNAVDLYSSKKSDDKHN